MALIVAALGSLVSCIAGFINAIVIFISNSFPKSSTCTPSDFAPVMIITYEEAG